ncbi:MAG: 50S ribosomal protein L32 [Actinopolymorphaceae bacterium]
MLHSGATHAGTKEKKSRSRTRSRRAHWKVKAPTLAVCSNAACRQPTLPHRACRHCGTYRGRSVIG